jgi:hypothetical protein
MSPRLNSKRCFGLVFRQLHDGVRIQHKHQWTGVVQGKGVEAANLTAAFGIAPTLAIGLAVSKAGCEPFERLAYRLQQDGDATSEPFYWEISNCLRHSGASSQPILGVAEVEIEKTACFSLRRLPK